LGPGTGAQLARDDSDDKTAETVEAGDTDAEPRGTDDDDDVRDELEDLDIYAGQPHGEDVYALVVYSEAAPEELEAELSTLRDRFDHYDTHVTSAVYTEESQSKGSAAVVSIWDTREAADTASSFLVDLPGVVERYDGSRGSDESGFGTMGMFYTVKPDYRGDFLDAFEGVTDILDGMEGHLETQLMVNTEDENDMFIASQWRAREDAMEFFRSDAFRETVQFGREILDGRPRHVFLA
jgi:chlorite dismutase